jgi:hypothetical protein
MVVDMRKLREEVDAEFSGNPPDLGRPTAAAGGTVREVNAATAIKPSPS